jgi:molybdenum cofactor cytidylyltransferase
VTAPDSPTEKFAAYRYPDPVTRHLEGVERIGALLLAAGASSRMGSPKALLAWDGRPLIQHQLAILGQVQFASVVVVLGHDESAISAAIRPDPNLRLAYNPLHARGRSSSVRLGVHLLGELDAILIVNVDQPLSPLLLSDLLAGAAENPEPLIVIPIYEGQRGHPVLIRQPLFRELANLDEHSLGLKMVIRRVKKRVKHVETTDAYSAISFSTPPEYEKAISGRFL